MSLAEPCVIDETDKKKQQKHQANLEKRLMDHDAIYSKQILGSTCELTSGQLDLLTQQLKFCFILKHGKRSIHIGVTFLAHLRDANNNHVKTPARAIFEHCIGCGEFFCHDFEEKMLKAMLYCEACQRIVNK